MHFAIVPGMREGFSDNEYWQSLAVKAQAGDRRAYNDLLREIARFAKSYLLPGLANPDWAEEITQETLISVHKSLKTYSPGRPFRPWLLAIIQFRRTDYLRMHYRSRADAQVPLENVDFQIQAVTDTAFPAEYGDVEKALAEIPERQRKVFKMMKIQGYSAEETARIMDMSVSAVKVSAHRTLGKLQKRLG